MKSIESENNYKFISKVVIINKDVSLEMIHIPGGSFLMGSPEDEVDRYDDEGPQHKVSLAPFWMAKYPTTQAQYQAIMGNNPAHFKGDNRPVERVSWYDAMELCDRLSKQMGQAYTLPSEAQWEYACRARTTTPFYFGDTITPELANYNGNQTTEVGSFSLNGFGLCDMHGNVWEWCLDHYHDSYNGAPADGTDWVDAEAEENKSRILRGGSWYNDPRHCRCTYRLTFYPDNRYPDVGFRVVCPA